MQETIRTYCTRVCVPLLVALQPGCALTPYFAYTNTSLAESKGTAPKASFEIAPRSTKKNSKVLVLLALSGGGSRAAYFSARTMLALQRVPQQEGAPVNVLDEVDLISSVSGGSLAAAYYASTYDLGDSPPSLGRRIWDEPTVKELMSQNYIGRWLGNWFWPVNIVKFWFTAFDRTDIMAQTFADNFFDSKATGIDLRMRDLNPARPNILLNATTGSRSYDECNRERAKRFGTIFTFTREDFAAKLNSDIADYEIARAVMASAAFPAAFNHMTLRDFNEPECPEHKGEYYLHVFDGGNSDNLGLISLKRVLLANHAAAIGMHNQARYQRIVVIFVDAFRNSRGANPSSPNPREFLDYFVDTNFMDATDSLLEANRLHILDEFFSRNIANYDKTQQGQRQCDRDNLPDHACVANSAWKRPSALELQEVLKQKLFFFHVNFDAVTDKVVREKLHSIPTTFKLEDGEMRAIESGVANIFADPPDPENSAHACVARLAQVIMAPDITEAMVAGNPWCGGTGQKEKNERARMLRP